MLFISSQQQLIMTTKDKIVALIQEVNPTRVALKSEVLILDPPQINPGDRNTAITVRAVPGSGYTGEVTVHYNRIDLARTNASGLMSEQVITTDAILQHLNQHTELTVLAEDLESIQVEVLEVGDTNTMTVTAKADSLGWVGTAEVAVLYGLPPNSDELYDLMNHLLPRP